MTAEITPETSTETTAQALSIAVGLHEAGAHDRAELLLRRVLAVDGCNPLALYALGRVLRALGRAVEASGRNGGRCEDALKSILALGGDHANQRGDDGEAIGF